jgi:REP element-mobilizing transposase RayT
MEGNVKEEVEVELSVREQSRQMNCEVYEMNVQADHLHAIVQGSSSRKGTKPRFLFNRARNRNAPDSNCVQDCRIAQPFGNELIFAGRPF